MQLQLQLHLVHAWTSTSTSSGNNRFANRGTAGSHVEQLRRLGLEQPQDSSVCFMANSNDDDLLGSSTASTTTTQTAPVKVGPRPRPCYYQYKKGEGQRLLRRQLQDLVPGQALQAFQVVSEKLEGKTGPKIFLDVGVGRYRVNGTRSNSTKTSSNTKDETVTVWSIVTAMVRLGGPNMKPSVSRKKATKIRQKCAVVPEKSKSSGGSASATRSSASATRSSASASASSSVSGLTVYVTRIDSASVRLEVSVDPEDGVAAAAAAKKKGSTSSSSPPTPSPAPVSSLQAGQELQGKIERIEDYGCLVRFQGVKRHGLLRIQSVADLYGTYISKKAGLIEAGLERGAAIKVQVANVTGKRLLLDFTNVTKEEALQERKEEAEAKEERLRQRRQQFDRSPAPQTSDAQTSKATAVSTTSATELSPEEEAAWAAYASQDPSAVDEEDEEDDDDDDDYDDDGDYDEDRDIEDALGLGSY
jgi:predicted RNA-binding protein with RPS1 domain